MSLRGEIGEILWHRIIEAEGPEFEIGFLLPDATPEAIEPHRGWMEPSFLEPGTGKLIMATQSYVLRTRHHVILVDSCVGNHKERRFYPPWSGLSGTRYLDNLAAIGLTPEDIDFVMCTHLHADHVGWNTRLVDGRWIPTFPNARYVFGRTEFDHWTELNKKGKKYSDGCIEDSVLPVVEAGQAEIVADDYAFNDEIWFTSTPGHTPGHVSIRLKSSGRNAILSGDVVHTPIQCREPGWSAVGCTDRALSAVTRDKFLDQYCETDTLVMTGHFPSPSVGYVHRHGNAYQFSFLDR
ncbi:MAG: MBL fold metallo-hydrolase [Rhodospirillales bacterium]|nr:MBL fold metallo-hydrolase [Rhodospirillales bacterium]